MSEHNFIELTRQNTGVDLCDSGGDSGRHWQQPPESPATPAIGWGDDGRGIINTATMLDETFDIELRFNCWPQDLAELVLQCKEKITYSNDEGYVYFGPKLENEDFSDDEIGELKDWVLNHINDHGMDSLDRIGELTNTYNGENDLSQDVIYEILSEANDWYDNENSVFLISTHNGADVRGGYSDTVLCTLKGTERNKLLEPVVGYRHVGTINDEIDPMPAYEVGYYSNPSYQLHDDMRWIGGRTSADGVNLTSEEFDKWVAETDDTSEGQILMVDNDVELDEGMAPPVGTPIYVFELDTTV